jgi:hypothetical protein
VASKFVVRGILFKLSRDTEITRDKDGLPLYLYGGHESNDEFAAKSSSHELHGAASFLQFRRKFDIHAPIQTLVDYHGHRLVAMPLLPLNHIIYGTCDQGATVHADYTPFNNAMRDAASQLHLAAHTVQGCTVYTGADVEGHLGHDGRFYVLDIARLFPPQSPRVCSHLPTIRGQSIFFRLFRPEFLAFLRRVGHPALSSDAFSSFGRADKSSHDANCEDATRVLLQVAKAHAIGLSHESEKVLQGLTPLSGGLRQELHRKGINMRHLGWLRSCIVEAEPEAEPEASLDEPTDGPWPSKLATSSHAGIDLGIASSKRQLGSNAALAREVLLVDMLARTLKNLFRKELRRQHAASAAEAVASSFASKEAIVYFLNQLSGAESPTTSVAFANAVQQALLFRFGDIALLPSERSSASPSDLVHPLFRLPILNSLSRLDTKQVGSERSTEVSKFTDNSRIHIIS